MEVFEGGYIIKRGKTVIADCGFSCLERSTSLNFLDFCHPICLGLSPAVSYKLKLN